MGGWLSQEDDDTSQSDDERLIKKSALYFMSLPHKQFLKPGQTLQETRAKLAALKRSISTPGLPTIYEGSEEETVPTPGFPHSASLPLVSQEEAKETPALKPTPKTTVPTTPKTPNKKAKKTTAATTTASTETTPATTTQSPNLACPPEKQQPETEADRKILETKGQPAESESVEDQKSHIDQEDEEDEDRAGEEAVIISLDTPPIFWFS